MNNNKPSKRLKEIAKNYAELPEDKKHRIIKDVRPICRELAENFEDITASDFEQIITGGAV